MAGTGNTGTAGNTILSGSVDPTDSVGNNSDYYINTSTSTLFGPKANGAWPPRVQMGGGTGSGTGGGGVLTGAGAPGNSVGNNGDYYLDTNSWTLYGPKANDVWPAGGLAGHTAGRQRRHCRQWRPHPVRQRCADRSTASIPRLTDASCSHASRITRSTASTN